MDNLLEIIVPVIFAAIYFFGNMLSGKADKDDAPKPPRRRPGNAEDDEAAERQRKIQEEIRRKILERRQQAEGRGPVPPVVSPPPMRGMRRHQPEQAKGTTAQTREASQPPPYMAPTHDAEPVAEGFSWGESDNAYEKEMEAKLRRIEETKRQAEKLKQKAASPLIESTTTSSKRRSNGLRLSGSVRSQLKNPGAARAAFVYGEVLGQPISMRKQSNVPGLS